MFTSEPSLIQRIERMIADTPIVDPLTYVSDAAPAAPDLATLLEEPALHQALRNAGLDAAASDPALSVADRVRRALPSLQAVQNTAAAWCFRRILRDLHDVHEPDLNEVDLDALAERAANSAAAPDWAAEVLKRANIRCIVGPWTAASQTTASLPQLRRRLDVSTLLAPGFSHRGDGIVAKNAYYDHLCAFLGDRLTSTEQLKAALERRLTAIVPADAAFLSASLPSSVSLGPPVESYAQFALNQASDDWDLTDGDVDALASFVLWCAFAWLHTRRRAIALTLGAEPRQGTSCLFPTTSTSQLGQLADLLRTFSHARVALVVDSPAIVDASFALARSTASVALFGYGPQLDAAPVITRTLSARIQTVPTTRQSALTSHAQTVEWVYARHQLARKATAASLAQLVETGFHEEHELPVLLRQLYHDAPCRFLDLTDSPPVPS